MSAASVVPDPALPQLPLLLDPAAIAPVLAETLGDEVHAVRIAYVTYDPGERILVQYEVTAGTGVHEAVVLADADKDLAARASAPESAALVRAVDGRTPARTPLAYDSDLDVLVQWPPLDLALPAYARPLDWVFERVEAAGVTLTGDIQVVHYKPGRRVALRVGNHFLKLYASRGQFERAVHNLREVESVPIRTPTCVAAVEDERIGVQSLVLGAQPNGSRAVAAEAGAVLARLHAAKLEGLREAPAPYWLRSAAKSARVLAAVVPSLRPRLDALVRELEQAMVETPSVPSHCDFDVRQLLELDGDYALVDFDSMSVAPPALDLASYISYTADHGGLEAASAALDAIVDGYGARPDNVSWYLAVILLRRARIPFRRFVDGWPDEIAARVGVAEEAART